MRAVVQEERTGCGIACAAAIAGISYQEAKQRAGDLGICSADQALWSDSEYVCRLLADLGWDTGREELPFTGWDSLPDRALLAIRWRMVQAKPFWHWVVFVREDGKAAVLDSKKSLKHNRRMDFYRMHPQWCIPVFPHTVQEICSSRAAC